MGETNPNEIVTRAADGWKLCGSGITLYNKYGGDSRSFSQDKQSAIFGLGWVDGTTLLSYYDRSNDTVNTCPAQALSDKISSGMETSLLM